MKIDWEKIKAAAAANSSGRMAKPAKEILDGASRDWAGDVAAAVTDAAEGEGFYSRDARRLAVQAMKTVRKDGQVWSVPGFVVSSTSRHESATCPKCGSDDIEWCHHAGSFALPECGYFKCVCGHQWGHS